MLNDYLSYAVKNITHRKLRSWLTVLGIVIGIASVVALISLGQGLQDAINTQFSALGTDKVTITAASGGFGPPGSGAVTPLTEHDKKIIEKVTGVKIVVGRMIRQVYMEFNDKGRFEYLVSNPEETRERKLVEETLNIKIKDGRLLEDGDFSKVVLGNKFTDSSLFGKEIFVGDRITLQEKDFEVIGIIEPIGSFQIDEAILMLESDVRDLLDVPENIDIIVAQIEKNADIDEVSQQIEKELRKDRNLNIGEEDFQVSTPQQTLDTANVILTVVQFIVIGIAAISLIVGGVGITNTMYTSVLERTNEIGVMKAIGAKNSDILWIFLLEAGVIGLFGGLIGLLIGVGLGLGVQSIGSQMLGADLLRVHFSWVLIIGSLLFSLGVGIISGLTPALQASKMKPVDSLRYE